MIRALVDEIRLKLFRYELIKGNYRKMRKTTNRRSSIGVRGFGKFLASLVLKKRYSFHRKFKTMDNLL